MMEKEAYRPRRIRRKRFVPFRVKKKRDLYRKKNRTKINRNARKWRQKNKSVLKRMQKLRRLRKK